MVDRVLDVALRVLDMGGALPPPTFAFLFLMLRPVLLGLGGLPSATVERSLTVVAGHSAQGPFKRGAPSGPLQAVLGSSHKDSHDVGMRGRASIRRSQPNFR